MHKLLRTALAAVLLCVLVVGLARPAAAHEIPGVNNFVIDSFVANYYLERDAQGVPTMRVDEVITADFPQQDQNHGILRAFPEVYKNQSLAVKVQQVTDASGKAWKYTKSSQNDNLVLRIGDADRYVHGRQTYHLVYTLRNPISFYDDHDELYWNVNGVQWQQHFRRVSATVHIPASLAGSLQERQLCYTGPLDSREQNCTITRTAGNNETTVAAQAANFDEGDNLSFVLGFAKATFQPDRAAQRARQIRYVLAGLGAAGLPLVAFVLMYRRWRAVGKDAKGRGTIVPQYMPLKELDVLRSDVLLQQRLRTTAITALIIELAVSKYITIYENKTEGGLLRRKDTTYELELNKPATGLSEEAQTVVRLLFDDIVAVGKRVSLDTLKNKLYQGVSKLNENAAERLFAQGYFRANPVKIRSRYLIWGGVMLFGTLLLGGSIGALGIVGVGLVVGWVLSGLVVLGFAMIMPARTEQGAAAREYLLGLRDYIGLAEADRLKYLQSPEGVKQYGDPSNPHAKVKLFEKLLPYAMIFGMEKDWAKQFKDIYSEPPEWYHGGGNAFNALYLAGAMSSFNTVSTAAFTAASSSGSSGFGGGGFSGGGGGGGGGGGW